MNSKKTHVSPATCTLLGSNLIQMSMGISAVWGSANVYYLSYFHYHNYGVDQFTNSLILIATIIPLSIILLLSTRICDALGYVKTIKLCSLIFTISQFGIYFNFSLLVFVIFTLIIPISCLSVSLIPTMNLLWSHFHRRKSVCTALNLVFMGIGTIIWNILFIHLVNPHNQQAEIDVQGNAYFSQNVIVNLPPSTKLIIGICSILFVAGALLMRQKQHQNNKAISKSIVVAQQDNHQEHGMQLAQQKQTKMSSEQKMQSDQQKQTVLGVQKLLSGSLTIALKDQRCLLLFLLLIVIDIYPIYLLNNFKVIYLPMLNDDHLLAYCLTINSIANIFGTFLWGFLADKYGVLKTITVIGSFSLLGGILGFFSNNFIVLIIFMIIFGLGDRGMETVAGPALIQIFDLKTATQLLPYKGLCLIIGFIIAPLFQIFTATFFNPFGELKFLFIFCCFSFFISLYYAKKYSKIGLKNQIFIKKSQQVNVNPTPVEKSFQKRKLSPQRDSERMVVEALHNDEVKIK